MYEFVFERIKYYAKHLDINDFLILFDTGIEIKFYHFL